MASEGTVKAAWIGGICVVVAALIPIFLRASSDDSRAPNPGPPSGSSSARATEVPVASPSPPPKTAPRPSAVSAPVGRAITLSDRSGPAGAQILITGQGFRASTDLYVATADEGQQAAAVTNEVGEFQILFALPSLACNGVPIVIVALDILGGDDAQAIYTVTSGGVAC
jgi:hypothetical protein